MREIIEKAWENRALLKEDSVQKTIREIIEQLDKGKIRVAEPVMLQILRHLVGGGETDHAMPGPFIGFANRRHGVFRRHGGRSSMPND